MSGSPSRTWGARLLAAGWLAAVAVPGVGAAQAAPDEPPVPTVLRPSADTHTPAAAETEPVAPSPPLALRRVRAADRDPGPPLSAEAFPPAGPPEAGEQDAPAPTVVAQQYGGMWDRGGMTYGGDSGLGLSSGGGLGYDASPGARLGGAALPDARLPGSLPGPYTSPFGGDLPPVPDLPLPDEEEEGDRPETPLGPADVEVTADAVAADNDVVTAEGDVVIFYEALILKADRAIVDLGEEKGYLHGHVIVDTPELVATGDALELDLESGDWTFSSEPPRRIHTMIDPRFFRGGVSEPLYVSGYRITVLSRRPSDPVLREEEGGAAMPRRIVIDHGRMTSCDLDYPHWHLQTDSDEGITIKPGRWATIERPSLYVLGHKVFTYPGKIPIDLKHRQFVLVPEVGYSRTEGYYAKFYHGYIGGPGDDGQGYFRLHLTTRRGIGAGVSHGFASREARGQFSFFGEPKTGGYSGRAMYARRWTRRLDSTFAGSFQTNTGYSTGTRTALTTRLGVAFRDEGLNTRADLHHSSYISTTSTHRLSSQIRHRHRLRPNLEYELETDYSLYSRSGQSAADQEMEISLNVSGDTRRLNWQLEAFKRLDLDGSSYSGDDGYRVLNVEPNIRLTSTLGRLGLPAPSWLQRWRSTMMRLELGRFVEDPSGTTLYRVYFRPDLTGYSRRFGDWGHVSIQPRFEQVWYNHHFAQFTVGTSSYFRAQLPDDWHYNIYHIFTNPHGRAALRQDFVAHSNRITTNLARTGRHTVLGFSTGYDLRRDYWQDLTASARLQPTRHSRLSLQTGYSIRRKEMRPLTLRYDYAEPDRLYMEASAQYDAERGGLQRVRGDFGWVISDDWEVEAILGYNPPTGRFDYADFRVVRDLHCWLAMLSYSSQQSEVRFQLSLKAFPWLSRYFGLGERGQRLSPIPGVYF
jgi:hypothetical protein